MLVPHTSAYGSIRQHTSLVGSFALACTTYVRIRQHTSAYVTGRLFCGLLAGRCFRSATSAPALQQLQLLCNKCNCCLCTCSATSATTLQQLQRLCTYSATARHLRTLRVPRCCNYSATPATALHLFCILPVAVAPASAGYFAARSICFFLSPASSRSARYRLQVGSQV